MALLALALAATCVRAELLDRVQQLRLNGCGGNAIPGEPFHHSPLLDEVAQRWAQGLTLAAAVTQSGYPAESTAALHLTGPETAAEETLRESSCQTLTRRELSDIGIHRRGAETWIVLAAPYPIPTPAETPLIVAQSLELVNAARAGGVRCGDQSYGPAPPLKRSSTLERAALGHARDMAKHNYFDHQDQAGRTAADRVRDAGYRERIVGENIAYGPTTAKDAVQGWLDSPGHCENLMNPRFTEMGVAFAAGRAGRRALYWVQVLAAQR